PDAVVQRLQTPLQQMRPEGFGDEAVANYL
ncbi:amino acid ABC transporter substrate-binding protein, partial [Pseudomonas aeruginosa]|nr:amino acid ABC transporter substrate-binding protein [Pseudomonas aeruginosa]